MKTWLGIVAVALTLMATAAQAEEPKIGVVDMRLVMSESKAVKHIGKQIESKMKATQKDLSKKEGSLRKKNTDLQKQKAVLSKDAFEGKVKDLQKEVTEASRYAQTKRAELEVANAKAMAKVQEELAGIIKEIAEDRGMTLVIPRSQILYFTKSMNITEPVLDELNDELPEVDVKVEKLDR